MGCKTSKASSQNDPDKEKSKKIDKELEADKARINREVKLLLLGAGESGKSTILKQMKVIYGTGYAADERQSFRDIVHLNCIKSMQSLLAGAQKLGIPLASPVQDKAKLINELSGRGNDQWTAEVGKAIQELWADQGIKKAYVRASEFQLIDSASYYFDNIERINDPSYVPNEQDVLRSRVATTGITETTFNVDNYIFRVTDVGGQRSERKKWISCFQDVTAVIFVVALSEYDQTLFEDETTNRMNESLQLFDEICNNKWFENTSIILFLNKQDIFKDKLERGIDPKVCFNDYNGGCDYTLATDYIKNRFLELNRSPSGREVFPKLTCATDTENMRFVFDAVKTIILQKRLEAVGFL